MELVNHIENTDPSNANDNPIVFTTEEAVSIITQWINVLEVASDEEQSVTMREAVSRSLKISQLFNHKIEVVVDNDGSTINTLKHKVIDISIRLWLIVLKLLQVDISTFRFIPYFIG